MPQTLPIPAGATQVTIPDLIFTGAPPPPPNQPPVVSAGASQLITLPINSVILNGTSSDPDGTIVSNQWTQLSGPGKAVIGTPSTTVTSASGLGVGIYTFQLAATDNNGATTFSITTVTVNPQPTPPPPPPPNGTIILQNGFDKSSDINSNQLGNGSLSTTVVKSGTGSFKSVVTAGEGQISGGWRSEQQFSGSESPSNTPLIIEYDEFFESLPDVGGLSVQWHGNTLGTSGQLSLWIGGGQFMVQRNVIGTAGSSNIYQSGNLMKIQTGRWYHMRWEINFSTGSDGYVRLIIDGVKYYDSGLTKTCDGSGQYLKVGQNLFSSPKVNSVMYIDNLVVTKLA